MWMILNYHIDWLSVFLSRPMFHVHSYCGIFYHLNPKILLSKYYVAVPYARTIWAAREMDYIAPWFKELSFHI